MVDMFSTQDLKSPFSIGDVVQVIKWLEKWTIWQIMWCEFR